MTRVADVSPPEGRPYRSLKGAHRFAEIRRRGRKVRRGGLVLMMAPGSPGPPEVGVVAGRRVGNAVVRNRAKRRLRAVAAEVALRPDTAYVLIASPEVVEAPFDRLVQWLRAAAEAVERGPE